MNIGDSFVNTVYDAEDSLKVIDKQLVINMVGDSVWRLEIQRQLNWIAKDTLIWIEGVGDKYSGLVRTNFPDGSWSHSCTHLSSGIKLYINDENVDYCNCTYAYGIDEDNDGYGNYIPGMATINLGLHINNPDAKKNYKVRACDTLKIISDDMQLVYFNSDTSCSGLIINPDLFDMTPDGKYAFYVNNLQGLSTIYLSDQCAWDFAKITIDTCFELDCNDMDPTINPLAEEIPNNGIDEDCTGTDLITAIPGLDGYTVDIFPNPTSSQLNVLVSEPINFHVRLFDISGKLVIHQFNKTVLDLSQLDSGFYLVEFQDITSGRRLVEKIIVVE